ncbi:rhomboid family intramembrane serine protease [Prauserella muralis]|uniref:Rhomboid family intramembrane serine protease n=1 Tax=Prauserella muralis TaxID=588067 RepID=A0A2V4B8Z0_9PSEU|nr:rhomboid family intramembrane serine protease [Prauserella muralis]PXY31727.1 rhomboid family intramembrane serine protease [Prauserella muralis]TWE13887.1 membrane associated rhomboid family serine protease [Prauserella muralis]
MSQPPYPPQSGQPYQQEALPGCWWHPNRQTGLRCVRCDRPACPDCLREASVGYQCVDCVQAGRQQQRVQAVQYRRAGYGARTVAGARLSQRAVVTPALIAVNVLVYVVTAVQARSPMNNDSSQLFADGVLWPAGIVVRDEWWRLVTSGFLHYGLIHIGMNMLALWILGRDLEILLGKVRFLAVYAVSLLGGAAAVFVFEDIRTGTAGASGAIYGLMGALLVAVLRLRLNPGAAIGIIVLNLILSVSIPGISLLGHLGGLVVGALAMAAMVYAPEKQRVVYQAGTVLVLTAALAGLVVYRDAQLAAQLCGTGLCA